MTPTFGLLSLLRRPFPRPESSSSRWLLVLGVSVFVTLFLLIFEPFGLSSEISQRVLVIAGYGAVTAICMSALLVLPTAMFPTYYSEERWTVWKEIVQLMVTISVIGLGNTLYTWWVFGYELDVRLFLSFQVITFVIGSIPASFIVLLQYQRYQQLFSRGARDIEAHIHAPHGHADPSRFTITDDEGRSAVDISVNDLVVMTAADNYVLVQWRTNGQHHQQLLRTSLKSIEERHPLPKAWFRCHRSHIVNIESVEHVSGNAQGYRLHCGSTIEIPVARSKSTKMRDLLRERSTL